MLFASLDDFYLTSEELARSPSAKDGVTQEVESELRRYGADIIAESIILLRLPQVVACTAQILFQRFYCKRSLLEFDVKVTAMAACWLACKLEEVVEIDSPTKLRLRDILMVFCRVVNRREERALDILDPGSRQYDIVKMSVVRTERHMLRSLGFILHAEHPHHLVLAFAPMLLLPETQNGDKVIQIAWNYANDSLKTSLCLKHKAHIIACAAIFLAARQEQVPLPEKNESIGLPPWWSVIAGVNNEPLASVCKELLELQKLPKAKYVCLVGPDITRNEERNDGKNVILEGVTPQKISDANLTDHERNGKYDGRVEVPKESKLSDVDSRKDLKSIDYRRDEYHRRRDDRKRSYSDRDRSRHRSHRGDHDSKCMHHRHEGHRHRRRDRYDH